MKHTLFIPLALAIGIGACASSGAVRAQRAGGDPSAMLANADANRDGRITRREFTDARGTLFDRLDRNRDGYVSSADGPRRRRGGGGGQRLEDLKRALDSNRDGRIDRREFVDAPGVLFERADTNGDEVVDRQELEEIQRNLAERRAGA